VLGLVLGYMIEANYRRSLLITNGDHIVFVQDPISALLLAAALLFIVISGLREMRLRRSAQAT
jgi:putative tricarboxylic transport membrane protein